MRQIDSLRTEAPVWLSSPRRPAEIPPASRSARSPRFQPSRHPRNLAFIWFRRIGSNGIEQDRTGSNGERVWRGSPLTKKGLRLRKPLIIWLRGLDLNQRPSGYEPEGVTAMLPHHEPSFTPLRQHRERQAAPRNAPAAGVRLGHRCSLPRAVARDQSPQNFTAGSLSTCPA